MNKKRINRNYVSRLKLLNQEFGWLEVKLSGIKTFLLYSDESVLYWSRDYMNPKGYLNYIITFSGNISKDSHVSIVLEKEWLELNLTFGPYHFTSDYISYITDLFEKFKSLKLFKVIRVCYQEDYKKSELDMLEEQLISLGFGEGDLVIPRENLIWHEWKEN